MDYLETDVNVPSTYLKAAAGGVGGSWYVLLEGLARLVAEIHPQLHIEVVEGGGVSNHIGTVDRMVFQLTLAHFGVSEPDVSRWGGALVPARSYDEQLALYTRNEVNALWQFMGIPSPSIQAAHTLRPPKALPFPDSLITALERLGWTAAALPAGAYGTVEQAVPTVAMGTSLGFHASVSQDIVYAITRVICDHAERVRQIHPAAQHFDPGTAHLQSRGPLHPGAARYFRAKGILPS